MQAIIFPQYGSPDVIQLREIAKPVPKADEILVKVHAASANPLDWHRLRADPSFARLSQGLFKPKNHQPGADVAGVVEEVGSGVTQFKPGNAVFGEIGAGSFAEYACAPGAKFYFKPDNVSFEAAAATPIVGLTAIQGMRDVGDLPRRKKVLVNGASGGIGTFAVQYAKSYDAQVTGVCSTRNVDFVRSIGADAVVDYTQQDFTQTGQQYDLIFDTVGNRTVPDFQRALEPGGIAVVAGFTTLSHMLQLMLQSALAARSDRPVKSMGTEMVKQKDLAVIADLLASGKVVPAIDRRYPLHETAEAIRYLETKRARGKVIIAVSPERQAGQEVNP